MMTLLRLLLLEAWDHPEKRKALIKREGVFIDPFDKAIFEELKQDPPTVERFYKNHGRLCAIKLMELLNEYDKRKL